MQPFVFSANNFSSNNKSFFDKLKDKQAKSATASYTEH